MMQTWHWTMLLVAVIVGSSVAPVRGASTGPADAPVNTGTLTPLDLSTIRGADYRGAGAADTTDYWKNYQAAETQRDLTYADKLKLNQLRVFVNETSWLADKAAFRKNLVDLARACNKHRIGLMITVGDSASFIDQDRAINKDRIYAFVTELVTAIGQEPALAFWDASNEPDYNASGTPADQQTKRMEIARLIAAKFHELDKKTPVTIGVASERNMEVLGDAVDVLSFHDYSSTRAAIANVIARAKNFASNANKQVMNTEMGCIARANPYDATLEEHMKAKIGWYVWELMITKKWGTVHGIFYPDGTVRDPAIPAAMFGLFRNRGDNVILENPNRENWVNTDNALAQQWLDNPAGDWKEGLTAAEKIANLLEAGQLIAMREPPSRALELLRKGQPNPAALREQITKYIDLLKPFERAGARASSGVKAATIPDPLAQLEVYPFPRREGSRTPVDTSTILGANYAWNSNSQAITERDLDHAQMLGINQLRVFTRGMQATDAYRQALQNLVRAADKRGIGIMLVAFEGGRQQNQDTADAWAKFLVDAVGTEPGLSFWDMCNEPDYPPQNNPTGDDPRSIFAQRMAGVFRKLDGHTPITIGWAYEANMEKYADDVDVLVFHNYLQTREIVRTDIEKAKTMAAKVKKQVMDDEMGCVCRANPYDMTIQEHMDAHIGFYIWELNIVFNNGRGWGDVHGIFYPDGTIRDPSIPMAMMGIFRNRGSDVVLEVPDREGRVTRAINEIRAWQTNPNADWKAGLDLAEVAANLLESAQLVPLRDLPTRQVAVIRRGQEDRPTLRALLEKDIVVLQQHAR